MADGWSTGRRNLYSTEYLWAQLPPDPVNKAVVKMGNWVKMTAQSGFMPAGSIDLLIAAAS